MAERRVRTALERGARGLGLALALAAATGCTPLYRTHGFVPSQSELMMLEPGIDTRDSVTETLGQPTAGGVLDERGLYYVQSRFRTVGPFQPQEVERQIVAMAFDAEGILRNIERYGLEDGRAVPLERRVTDAGLRDTTFLRQLMGNLGNFDATRFIGDED
ncbi:outer membrane protein assembly factor BamE [Histidinibacterium lentulum]|uniref:Outer membrane protein assembly factor BamE n=1 Tax=Histidinibacterium lentulum TaxID=2480588 RepID=A0A3N2QYH2_9RHOB|nr:outer membrane protein assembly factor BamE [Histidinibacterium lentulum]ROU00193.1 outer membrane protein assembly factor BamE [Histidinibacterium lentulum]